MGTVSGGSSSVGEAPVMQGGVAMELRKGPWTVEEDLVLVNYIAVHGEGRWNSLARSAGLKRSGKSCRLRWLNYLRPDVRRGNFTLEEQLLILHLHSRWGNRWSKIAQQLPGRTDNEVKNYWRTRVQKHARQLKCDVDSQQFKDAVRHHWIPHLIERICAAAASTAANATAACVASTSTSTVANTCVVPLTTAAAMRGQAPGDDAHVILSPDHPSTAGASSDSSAGTWPSSPSLSDLTADCHVVQGFSSSSDYGDEFTAFVAGGCSGSLLSPCGYNQPGFPDFEQIGCGAAGGFSSDNLWATDDGIWF